MEEKEVLQELEELKANKTFIEQIKNATTVDDLVEAHREAGYDIDRDDITALSAAQSDSELSESDLENVAGGGALLTLAGLGIKYFWDMTPGDSAREKTDWLVDWYKDNVFKKKKKNKKSKK